MSEFSTRETIKAPADDVFAYVTDFDNMPQYLPTVKRATPAGEGKIRMQGEVNGKTYDTEGWYQVHSFNKTMLWGAKGANDYSGDLEIVDQGDSCVLSINLKFESLPDVSPEDRQQIEQHFPQIKDGLDQAGRLVKRQCEEAFASTNKQSQGYLG